MLAKIKALFTKDVAVRAAKTFAQAFVAAIVLPAADAFNLASWKAAVLAAGAAAASVVWNTVLNPTVGAVQAKLSR